MINLPGSSHQHRFRHMGGATYSCSCGAWVVDKAGR